MKLEDELELPDLPSWLEQVQIRLLAATGRAPAQLAEACARQVRAGGKRIRPSIMLACARLFKSEISELDLDASAALELVHTGSLIHDDIIDDSSTRRGIPTINSVEGEHQAIVGGDLLLGVAGLLATGVSQDVGRNLSEAIVRLCSGQTIEMLREWDASKPRSEYEIAIYGKTAALLESSCAIGAMCGGAPESSIAALSEFGRDFGMAFQVIDDVLDIAAADPSSWGKPMGADLRAGVMTLPMILHRDSGATDNFEGRLNSIWTRRLEADESEIEQIRMELLRSPAITESLSIAYSYVSRAEASIGAVAGPESGWSALQSLPRRYIDDARSKMLQPD